MFLVILKPDDCLWTLAIICILLLDERQDKNCKFNSSIITVHDVNANIFVLREKKMSRLYVWLWPRHTRLK